MDDYTKNTILAYVNKYSGYTEKYIIKDNPENVAKFIMFKGRDGDITLTDWLDEMVGRTFGTFVDRFTDQTYMQDVLKKLVPMQQGNRVPLETEVEMVDYYSID